MKRILFITSLLFVISFSLHAQNMELKQYSSILDGDFENDFSGIATATYMTETEFELSQIIIGSVGRDVSKLTKNNMWLCWKALDEWEYEEGEYYLILCAANAYSDTGLIVFATIDEGGETFSWTATAVDNDDFDSF